MYRWKPTQRDLIATKWKVLIKFLIRTVSYTVIRYAKANCNKKPRFLVPQYFTEHLFTSRWTPVFRGDTQFGKRWYGLLVEWYWERKTEVLGKTLFHCLVVRHKSHVMWSGTPTRAFSVRGSRMTTWDMTADWGRCTGLSVGSKCEVLRWFSDRTGWRAVHATGLSVDGCDFLYM